MMICKRDAKFNTVHCGRVHPKGWGYELWIENNKNYCGKLLVFNPGKSCSMHFHAVKEETMYLQSGHLQILLIDPQTGKQYTEELNPGDSIFIPRNQMHQILAPPTNTGPSELFEFSTTHDDKDSYRVWKGD